MIEITGGVILGGVILYFLSGIKILRPTERGVVETLGKFSSYREAGFNFVFPIFQKITRVNVTERMTDIEPQEIITKDNLNAQVDLVVYYKIKKDEDNVKKALYEVHDVIAQLETLARTTARNVIGTMPFREVNSERKTLNDRLQALLETETKNWGVDVLRVELKDITPPGSVQETMNKVIQAENEKDASKDLATAVETQADGKKRAAVKEAEGIKQSKIIVAEGQAQAIKLVNEAAEKYFKSNAQKLKQMEVTQASLESNSKIIITDKGINPNLIIGDIPIKETK